MKTLLDDVRLYTQSPVRWSPARRQFPGFLAQYASTTDTPEAFEDRIFKAEYLSCFEVLTEWNDQSYLFETETDFGYVSWGTSA